MLEIQNSLTVLYNIFFFEGSFDRLEGLDAFRFFFKHVNGFLSNIGEATAPDDKLSYV